MMRWVRAAVRSWVRPGSAGEIHSILPAGSATSHHIGHRLIRSLCRSAQPPDPVYSYHRWHAVSRRGSALLPAAPPLRRPTPRSTGKAPHVQIAPPTVRSIIRLPHAHGGMDLPTIPPCALAIFPQAQGERASLGQAQWRYHHLHAIPKSAMGSGHAYLPTRQNCRAIFPWTLPNDSRGHSYHRRVLENKQTAISDNQGTPREKEVERNAPGRENGPLACG
jgi:hypothetical protein